MPSSQNDIDKKTAGRKNSFANDSEVICISFDGGSARKEEGKMMRRNVVRVHQCGWPICRGTSWPRKDTGWEINVHYYIILGLYSWRACLLFSRLQYMRIQTCEIMLRCAPSCLRLRVWAVLIKRLFKEEKEKKSKKKKKEEEEKKRKKEEEGGGGVVR